jgi:hypothetical protein
MNLKGIGWEDVDRVHVAVYRDDWQAPGEFLD